VIHNSSRAKSWHGAIPQSDHHGHSGGGGAWRRLQRSATLIVVFGVMATLGVGCGGGGESVRSIPPSAVRASFTQRGSGASAEEVLKLLGPPISRVSEGGREELNYGVGQVVINDGRLERKTIVRSPAPESQRATVTTKEILGLSLGAPLRSVERQLGLPEASYETWEGQNERVAVLRYGEWQLTFVEDHLTQRSR
jgi:hypothetical protein